jgi:hypothetical protein
MEYMENSDLVISTDTKKNELIDNFMNRRKGWKASGGIEEQCLRFHFQG